MSRSNRRPPESTVVHQIEYHAPGELRPFAQNSRAHSKEQISRIAESVRRFGFVAPVLIDDNKGIIAGHARVEAAKLIGLPKVPCLAVQHLSEAEKRAYIIADNRLAELATWNRKVLAEEFEFLAAFDLDIELTGFATAEIDLILEAEHSHDPADSVPAPDTERPPNSLPGDVWQLGDHALICGNALDPSVYAELLQGELAQQVIADPPYNVPIAGHVSGLGRVKHRDFAMATGEMPRPAFIAFLKAVFAYLIAHSVDGALHFHFIDWRHVVEMQAAGEAVYSELKALCVWAKTNGGMGSLYRSRHELVYVWKAGTGKHINNIELGRHGRNRTNVWEYPGANGFAAGRTDALSMHPTVKPVALIADAIRDCSKRGGLILDPFVGSGTTIIAAERTGRKARAIELDPRYVDVALRRFEAVIGRPAILRSTGESFAETKRRRDGHHQLAAPTTLRLPAKSP